MRELFSKLDNILDLIDFAKIWQGFHKFPFAIYDHNDVYFHNGTIPRDRRFLGNTSIEYDGRHIAIWNVTNPASEDCEVLAADLVHEMFHAFQLEKNENRFPNDLLLLNYPDNAENFIIKHSENLLLAKAFDSVKADDKRVFLNRFITARKYREGLIGDIIKQEYLSETIEGMAEYAGCISLKQISHEKYDNRIKNYTENLKSLDNRFFDIRKMLYYSGALFGILLAETRKTFCHSVGETELTLFEIASDNAAPEKPPTEDDENAMSVKIDEYLSDKKRKFDEFLSLSSDEVEFDSFICGYDPMNMIKLDDKILCSHFVMLSNTEKEEPLFIEGPVMIRLRNGKINEVLSYIKPRS